MIKKVIYRNELGQEIVFDNKMLFCESIDMTGSTGVHAAETLAFADGQVTIGHQIAAKTIPCSFALKDVNNDIWLRNRLAEVFNPLTSGTLTVYDRENKYEIDVYPQDVPVFTADKKVKYVYRWNVDFVADYPYWRVGVRQSLPLTHNAYNTVNNPCSVSLPIKVMFKGRCTFAVLGARSTSFTVEQLGTVENPQPVTVNTQTYSVTDENGSNVNYLISASAELDKVVLLPGANRVMLLGDYDGTMSYYHLSTGVF